MAGSGQTILHIVKKFKKGIQRGEKKQTKKLLMENLRAGRSGTR